MGGTDPSPGDLAFGTGPHVCLGARLARMELTAFFGALVSRLRTAELDGRPQLVHTVFGGLKLRDVLGREGISDRLEAKYIGHRGIEESR